MSHCNGIDATQFCMEVHVRHQPGFLDSGNPILPPFALHAAWYYHTKSLVQPLLLKSFPNLRLEARINLMMGKIAKFLHAEIRIS